MRLKDKVAVVTGSAQGIGRAVAELYAREGARVAVVDVQAEAAEKVAAGIREAGGDAIAVLCDVSSRAAVNEAADAVRAAYGPIDILVNNAGVIRPAMLHKMTDEQWETVLGVHLHGAFYWLQAVVNDMIERERGWIIFTSSSTAQNGSIGQINYAAAKSGGLAMVRTAARELGRYNILVNAVAPAAATEMTLKVRTDPRFADAVKRMPLRRHAEPEEIAPTFVYLASDEASYVTGQVISVDGGGMMVR
ncbi:SDR family oxidoreductase [Microbispora amethystogenes]|uniref:SDR family NAD(P)-dependent oxidoreductase n=1 Tax=Microbispora amethystogenes TaxID=1427754 RepID=UPI0033DD48C9